MEDIQKLTLTGGPCGGKTLSSPFALEAAKEEGFTTFFSEETATELIKAGLIPGVTAPLENFQEEIFDRQNEKEERLLKYARKVESDRVALVCDRGLGDGLVYQSDEGVNRLLEKKGYTKEQVVNRNKNIIHFITIAKDKPELFDVEGRLEAVAEACRLDDALLKFYSGKLNKIILYNTGGLEEKQRDTKIATKALLRTGMKRIIIRREAFGALDKLEIIPTTSEDEQSRFLVKEGRNVYTLGIYNDGSFMRTLDIMNGTPIPKWVLEYEEIPIPRPKKLVMTTNR